MATRFNDGTRNRLADSLGTAFDSGVLEIYSGAQPATGGTLASGVLLASITLPVDSFAAAATGAAAKAGTWSATVATGGTAGWGRFRNTGDTLRMDIAIAATGAEMTLDNYALVAGGTVTVNTFTITQPAA